MFRVSTQLSGTVVTGGGLSQMYFSQSVGTAADAHAAVAAFWYAISPLVTSALTMTILPEVELVDTASGQVEGIETTDQVTYLGGPTADPLPLASQGLVRWRTGIYTGGREIRGRTFLPGMLETNSTNGKPAGALISAVNAAAGSLYGDPDAQLVVYSRTHGVQADVTSASMWTEWAQLRSRRD